MNESGFEDLLFGDLDTQLSSDDNLLDESDDEILFPPEDGQYELWIATNNSSLAPNVADIPCGQPIRTTDMKHTQDQTDCRSNEHTKFPVRDRHWVITHIESMLERIVGGLLGEHESLTITLKSRSSLSRRRANGTEGAEPIPKPKERDINFPGVNAQEAWNFTVLLRILELIHGGLSDNTIMTKRDIYYRHPDLFVKQSVVDRYVDDLACTFGVTRSQLNVTAATKGLVAGNFRLRQDNNYIVHGLSNKESLLIPTVRESDVWDLTSVHWVLVIEKEATFRSLIGSSQWGVLGLHGVILTAKGYPDVASRQFLRQLGNSAPHVPMFVLVDLDPDGIAILSTYKYGSYRLAHEDVTPMNTPAISLSNTLWLGVKSHHLTRELIGEDGTETKGMHQLQGLMRLTTRDRTKAVRMLEWNLCAEDGPEPSWRRELQVMLMLNVKAEMQVLDELSGGLVPWLSDQLGHGKDAVCTLPIGSDCSDDGMLF